MATSRTYNDACGMAHALDLVGERWSLLIVRELVLGPKRYSDLRADLPGISTNVLSHRLDELERAGVLQRLRLPAPAASWVYELTPWGRELEPIIQTLGRWGARSPAHRRDAHLSVSSLILSLRTNFDADRADGVQGVFVLRLGDDRFTAQVGAGSLGIARGEAAAPDAALTGEPATFASVIYGGDDIAGAVDDGTLAVDGDASAAVRFLSLFTLPEPVFSA